MANLFTFHFSNSIIILEMVALLFSLFTFSKSNEKELRIFVPILAYICVTEFLGSIIHHYNWGKNVFVYNILDIITILGYLYIISKLLVNQNLRNYIFYGMAVFFTFSVANILFIQGFSEWTTYTTIFGALVILISVVFAFIEISNYPYKISLRRKPLFWICCAMLVYFLPTAVMTGSYSYFSLSVQSAKVYSDAYFFSQQFFNLLHYGLLSYSFICQLIFTV